MKEVITLDLHGVRHDDAMLVVEEWAVLWDYRIPAFTGKIITGNSVKMRILAESALRKNNFDYQFLADGSILVNGKI